MKRNWDVIREVLLEVEALNPAQLETRRYGPLKRSENPAKDVQALLLWKAGFIEGYDSSSLDLGDGMLAKDLTWQGHELLDTMRSQPVWEKIKSTAQEKGIELSFDAVIALGKMVLAGLVGGGQ